MYYGIFSDYCTQASIASAVILTGMGFFGTPLIVWSLTVGALLWGFGAPIGVMVVWAALAVLLNFRPLRAVVLSLPIMKAMKAFKLVPTISETERAAIDAGVVWMEGELFSGKPDFKKMMSQPYAQLTKEEQAFIDGPVEELCKMIDDWKVWRNMELPDEIMTRIKKIGLLGMIVPKEYGGLGFSPLFNSEVVKKVSTRSITAGITIMVPNSLGPAELLSHYGTKAQKERYLPKLATGEEMPCFALTEPGAGSDAASIQSYGEVFKRADGTICIRLHWEKRWITLAAISTVLGLAFKLRDPQNILGKGTELGITCALIPSNAPGVQLGRRHDPMGIPFYNCPTRGKDVEVVLEDAVIGGMDGIGRGWHMLMDCLGAGRGISLPAQSTGGTQMAALLASAHSAVRKQFGLPIGKFEGIEEPLARIAGNAYTLEASRRYICGALGAHIKPPIVTAIAKYVSTEFMRKSVNDAMDILGGAGISRGPKNAIASCYTGIPIGITVEGANILTRTLMIFGQGALRAHPFAKMEVTAVEKSDVFGFDKAFFGHVGHVIRNLIRSFVLSFTRGRLACTSDFCGPVRKYQRKIAWGSASFAILADVAMGALGGKLKVRENLTGRFADILANLYLATAVLRRWDAEGRPKEDLPFVHYSCQMALHNAQEGFDGIFANFDGSLGYVFKWLIRPWSSLNRLGSIPSDELSHQVAQLMQTPGASRDRLVHGIYIPKDPKDHTAQMEECFRLVKAVEETDRKVKKAVRQKVLPKIKGVQLFEEAFKKGVINQTEFDQLSKVEKLRWDVIQVDEFTLEEYARRA